MEEMKDTKVKNPRQLLSEARALLNGIEPHLLDYEHSRSVNTTGEEKFNEGRHGRLTVSYIDETIARLTQLKMRVNLQLDGRDSARARQLDRILGMSEEDTKLVDAMLDIAKNVVDRQRDDGGGTT